MKANPDIMGKSHDKRVTKAPRWPENLICNNRKSKEGLARASARAAAATVAAGIYFRRGCTQSIALALPLPFCFAFAIAIYQRPRFDEPLANHLVAAVGSLLGGFALAGCSDGGGSSER
jgi:hypothetical protein